MKQAANALCLLLLLAGCSENAGSVFRPDFGKANPPAYTPPSASARAQAARNVGRPSADTQTQSSKVRPTPPDARSPAAPGGTPPAAQRPPAASVGAHYQQQLDLHKGGTTPGYTPPKPPPKERSWFDALFGADDPASAQPAPGNCYTGRLTSEGVTCQAMRTNDGRLLTLGGPLRGFGSGDRVCVCGTVAEVSFCQQGTTVYVARIDTHCNAR